MFSLAHHVQSQVWSLIGQLRYQLFERHYIYTLRISLVVTTVLLTLITVILFNEIGLFGLVLVAGVGALCAMVVVYNYLDRAVFLLLITTTIADPPLERDMTTTLLLLLLLVGIWLFRLVLIERSFHSVRPALPNKIVVLFAVVVVISFLWSNTYVDLRVSYLQNDKLLPRIVTALVMILSPVAMLLFGNAMRTAGDLKRVIWYFIGYSTLPMMARILAVELPSNFNMGGQLSVWASVFALGQVLFNHELNRYARLALVGVIAGWAYVQISLGITWLSGWVPLALGAIILIFLRSRAAFVVVLVIAAVFALTNSDFFQQVFAAETEESGETRVQAGAYALQVAHDHFLFGTGPAGYYFYLTVYVGGLFQLSHNNYLDIYAQTGIFGFAAWLALWGAVGWTVWRAYRAAPPRGFLGGLAASLMAIYPITLLIMMLGDWVTPFTYTQTMRGFSYTIWPWLWAGMAIALNYIVHQEPPEATPHAEDHVH
jgi:O-antigen ligase